MTISNTITLLTAAAAASLLSSCALWFVPESSSRGHIFDEAVRGRTQLDGQHGVEMLEVVIRNHFPPGTSADDVIGHIMAAGGICKSPEEPGEASGGREMTICTYSDSHYYATAPMGMGEVYYRLAENDWTVVIFHADDAVQRYDIENQAVMHILSREDYYVGLRRQRDEEN